MNHKPYPNHSNHLDILFDHVRRSEAILKMYESIKEKDLRPDVLVSSGLSGNTVALQLAELLGIGNIIVRKQGEDSHGMQVEGSIDYEKPFKYLIIDEFISSGDTVRRIYRNLKSKAPKGQVLGVMLYEKIYSPSLEEDIRTINLRDWREDDDKDINVPVYRFPYQKD